MKISIIVWDAGFRERYHTTDFFHHQNFPGNEYEFIWVDYYKVNSQLKNKIKNIENFKYIDLNSPSNKHWHLGQCMNHGVMQSCGDILVFPDGDIACEDGLLQHIYEEHNKYDDDLVLYHRRFDEPEAYSCSESLTNIEYLKTNTRLTNPTNYAGCFSVRRSNFLAVGGYEEHQAFSGPGMNAMELYLRFRNKGLAIKWSSAHNVYHPWHPNTKIAGEKQQLRKTLQKASADHRWINPYAGLEQSWISHCREKFLDTQADIDKCNQYLLLMPQISLGNNLP